MLTLRSTIGVLTIRPIKENFQWHFGVAACCLSKAGWGGDACTFFARFSLHSPAPHIIETNNKIDTCSLPSNVVMNKYECCLQPSFGIVFTFLEMMNSFTRNEEHPVHVICVPAPVSPQSSVGNDGCNITAVFRTHGKQICPP